MILALSSICSGEDKLAKRYMVVGVRMAETLHLIGADRHSLEQFDNLTEAERHMHSHVAWGAFNFST